MNNNDVANSSYATNKTQEKKQKYQRNFFISSPKAKEIIDGRLNDISKITNKSISQIIENILIENLLCKNEDARSIMMNDLYSGKENSIQETMIAIFNLNLVRDKKYNIKPFIDFLLFWAFQDDVIDLTEEDHSEFLSLYKEIIERIEEYVQQHKYEIENLEEIEQANIKAAFENTEIPYKDCRPPWWWWNYLQQTEWANKLYQLDCDEFALKLHLRYHMQILWNFWDVLVDYNTTYTFLIFIAEKATFIENETGRNKVCSIFNEVSEEWESDKITG